MKMSKTLFIACLIVCLSNASKHVTEDASIQFVDGIFEGFGVDSKGVDIQNCIKDVQTLSSSIENAVWLIEQGDFTGIITGLRDLMDSMYEVSTAMINCNVRPDKAQQLKDAADELQNSVEIYYEPGAELTINGHHVFTEVGAGTVAYYAGLNETAGLYYGKILNKFTQTNDDDADLIQGVMDGLNLGIKYQDIQECLKDLENLASQLGDIVNSIKKGTISDILAAIQKLKSLFGTLPNLISDCKSFEPKHVIKAMERFANSTSIDFKRGSSVKLEGKEVYGHLLDIVQFYEAKHYKKLGKEFGRMVYKFTQV